MFDDIDRGSSGGPVSAGFGELSNVGPGAKKRLALAFATGLCLSHLLDQIVVNGPIILRVATHIM